MSKIDYEFKAKVLASGLCDIEKKISKTLYVHNLEDKYNTNIDSKHIYPLEVANQIIQENMENNPDEWIEASKINHATYQRVKRLKDRISRLLEKPCLFLTLTFKNKTLFNTKAKTRRSYVTRYLKRCKGEFVGNKDFGKKKGREHYHAVIQAERIDYSKWKYGAIKGLKVRLNGESSKERLAKYVAKLTNHAIKETTKRSVLIYSRQKRLKKCA